MKLVQIYQCLCDETRLRLLNLLARGPLCVCHLQEIVGESQVNVSRHLAYLKERGMVESRRHQNWMIYHLPERRSLELKANLKCLQDCVSTEPVFKRDLVALRRVLGGEGVRDVLEQACCPSCQTDAKKRAKSHK